MADSVRFVKFIQLDENHFIVKKLECVDLQRKNLRISRESLCGALGKVFKLVVGCGSEQIGLNSLRRALNADESPNSS